MKNYKFYFSPECEILPYCWESVLCDSGMGGSNEDIDYIDWGDLADGN